MFSGIFWTILVWKHSDSPWRSVDHWNVTATRLGSAGVARVNPHPVCHMREGPNKIAWPCEFYCVLTQFVLPARWQIEVRLQTGFHDTWILLKWIQLGSQGTHGRHLTKHVTNICFVLQLLSSWYIVTNRKCFQHNCQHVLIIVVIKLKALWYYALCYQVQGQINVCRPDPPAQILGAV